MKPVAVILGSTFDAGILSGVELDAIEVETAWGPQALYRSQLDAKVGYIIFRHGLTHRVPPNQTNSRAQVDALHQLGCGALLVTSAVEVLDSDVPLHRPMLVSDLIMPDNRLSDGSACTMFDGPAHGQGQLIIKGGLFSRALREQLGALSQDLEGSLGPEVVFGYNLGPRTRTLAESRMWSRLGAQVDAMTIAPEVILANELQIPCAGLVVGSDYVLPEHRHREAPTDRPSERPARAATEKLVVEFLARGAPVEFDNEVRRFGHGP